MLALTRKSGERIVVSENIVITVVDIKGDSVRLAIDAPREIKIYRGEIFDSIVTENKQAAVADIQKLDFIKGFGNKK
jgi:carbon storage regulator